ncbi:flagellin [Limnohabitans sp. Rim8]|uniref:flagellin N-terminal helical domain-containing protein n=1 Tax=Limnohabitans sp. Rim8 TaxID=1100718 RepID=UPI003305EBB2
MTVINTNIKALYTENSLQEAQRASLVASKQLATGKRINSSMDDPAGMAVVTRMTQNIKSLQQANLNAGYGISLIQTADASLASITTMLQRMSELALQAQNGTMTDLQRSSLDNEFQQITAEIVRTSLTTSWNGAPILSGDAGTQVGQPKFTGEARAIVAVAGTPIALGASDLKITNSSGVAFAIPASSTTPDTVSMASTLVTSSSPSASAIAIAKAINTQTASTGVVATPHAAQIDGLKTTIDSTADVQTNLFVNGERVILTLGKDQTPAERRAYVVQTINSGVAQHGVTAEDSGLGGLTLKTPDGRNLSVWYDNTVADASDFGLGSDATISADVSGVTGMSTANSVLTTGVPASTLYGTVSMTSDTTFSLANGNTAPAIGNFTALMLESGTYKAQKISRLDFQVGAQANQIISIELADFGKEGPITGSVTSDTAPVHVSTVELAKNASIQIAIAAEAVSKARASMGAIINRLQDVADNLTSATTNEISSRSEIEDSDYAAASTELSRTTILQQAATAILAQANTDMQTVMKLLQ